MTSTLSPAMEAMAGELALGVLEGEAKAKALRHALSNREFAACVSEWHTCLDPLFEAFEEMPPPDVWRQVEAHLNGYLRTAELRKIRFWRRTSIAMGAVAAGLAALIVVGTTPTRELEKPALAPAVIAQLAGEGATFLAADLSAEQSQLRIRAVAMPASDLVPELWIIPGDGVPRSLGLISPQGTSLIVLRPELKSLLIDGAVLAVSLEPADGAPHRAPSSIPIATGKITTL